VRWDISRVDPSYLPIEERGPKGLRAVSLARAVPDAGLAEAPALRKVTASLAQRER
jgi:hypothetical protein